MSGAGAFAPAQMFGIKMSPSVGGACLLTTFTAAMAAGMVNVLSIVLPRRFSAEAQFAEVSGSQTGDLELLRLELEMIRWEVRNQSKGFHEMLAAREAWPDEAAAAEERARDSEILRAVRGDMLVGLEAQRNQLITAMAEAAATARREALEEFAQILALESMQSRRQQREDSIRLRGAILNASQTQHGDIVEILSEQLLTLQKLQKARLSGEAPKESSAGALVGKGLWGFLASSMKEGDNSTNTVGPGPEV